MANEEGPQWLQDLSGEKLEILKKKADSKNLDLIDMAWRCDEWWQAKASKKKARWFSRLSNWLDIASPRPKPTYQAAQPGRGFQPPNGQVRDRRPVSKV